MLSKEEIEKAIERLKYINMAYDCYNYYSRYDLDCIETLLQYIEQLESKLKELCKGQHVLMQSRKKWKKRYYKERKRRKEADKSVEQIYSDYQDAGKKMFEYAEQAEQLETNNKKLIEKLEDKIRYFEENEEFIASNNDNYSDGTVIYKFITEFKEILEIAKGEKE